MKTKRECPACGTLMTPHEGVTSSERRTKKTVRMGDADFFSCPKCVKFWNTCDKHGIFEAEVHGLFCPQCWPGEGA